MSVVYIEASPGADLAPSDIKPECGRDFCEECGDCLECYGDFCVDGCWAVRWATGDERPDGRVVYSEAS